MGHVKHRSSKAVSNNPTNYTPGIKQMATKSVEAPKVTKVVKYARKNMPNLKGIEPVFQMSGKIDKELSERKERRMKQGL